MHATTTSSTFETVALARAQAHLHLRAAKDPDREALRLLTREHRLDDDLLDLMIRGGYGSPTDVYDLHATDDGDLDQLLEELEIVGDGELLEDDDVDQIRCELALLEGEADPAGQDHLIARVAALALDHGTWVGLFERGSAENEAYLDTVAQRWAHRGLVEAGLA